MMSNVTKWSVFQNHNKLLESLNLLSLGPMDSKEDSTGVVIGTIVGGIIAIVLILLLLLMIVWCYCNKYKKKRKPGMYMYVLYVLFDNFICTLMYSYL